MVFVKKTYKQKVVENLHSIIVIAVLASIHSPASEAIGWTY